jgi:DNA-binding NtrC family response regulator
MQQSFAHQSHDQALMAALPAMTCLILVGDAGIGRQIAGLMERCRWQAKVVQSDRLAYECLLEHDVCTVVADIDTADLGGLALLAFCHRRHPDIMTYAIARPGDEYGQRMAREAGGCRGFFGLYERASGD